MFQFLVGVFVGIMLVSADIVPMQKTLVDEVIEKIEEMK